MIIILMMLYLSARMVVMNVLILLPRSSCHSYWSEAGWIKRKEAGSSGLITGIGE